MRASHPSPQITDARDDESPMIIAANITAQKVELEFDAELRSSFDDAPIGVRWLDVSGTILWANRSELAMLGYEREDYIGQPMRKFYCDAEQFDNEIARLKRGEAIKNVEVALRRKDGTTCIVELTANAQCQGDQFVHFRCFARDLTIAKSFEAEARAQFNELETIYRTAPVGLAYLDNESRFLRINSRLAEINGVPAHQHLGRTVRDVVPSLADQAESILRDVLKTGRAVLNVEISGITQAQPGVQRIWNESWYPVKDSSDTTVGVNVVVEEITERKRAEAALAESVRINSALYRLTDQLHRARSIDHVYSAALFAICDAMRCDRASILLFDETQSMHFVAWRGLSQSYRAAVDGHSPWKYGEKNPQPLSIGDISTADLSDDLKATIAGEGIGSLAFIPLVFNDELIGKFMTYFDGPHSFSTDEMNLGLAIGRQLAFGIQQKRSEERLRENERRFRQIIDALPAAIYTTDAEGRVTHYNAAAVEFSGREPVLGSDQWCISWKLFRPDGSPLVLDQCPMAVALKEARIVRDVEAIIERPDGSRRWFTSYPTPLFDVAGGLIGGINMLVDITDRKLTEQAMQHHMRQLALISEAAPVFIAHCDRESRYKFVNKAYADRFNVDASECVGKHIAELLGDNVYTNVLPQIEKVLAGETVDFEIDVPQPIGLRHMMCSYAPERNEEGEVVGWVAAINDITDQKRIESELRASQQKLRETDRRKDEFLAMLAHELRNPLAPISNAVQLLRSDLGWPDTLQQARAIIERQTGRLARLVDDLLEVSRITTGRIRLHMESIAVAGIVEKAVESVRPLINKYRHALSVSIPDEPIWLSADAARLEQVMVNLLTNAVKYTDEGGHIELRVEVRGDSAFIVVKDNGIGIDEDLLPHVFDLFTQSDQALDRSNGGLGIGLSLVQRLVSMHGGTVNVTSQVGKGSEFIVTMPLATPPRIELKSHTEAVDSPKGALRVLIVDDNVDAAKSLAMLLELTGHRIWLAHDGLEALTVAKGCTPHVAFLDIGLPKMDGYALAGHLKTTNPDTVLVAMTGYGQTTDRDRAYSAGFAHHLVKPVDFSRIEDILKDVAQSIRSV